MIEYLNIIAGLILCVSFLEAVPSLHKFAKWLGGFDTIIGIVIIIYVVAFWGGDIVSLQGILAIFAGLIMIVGILPAIPAVGKNLEKVAKWLGGFQGIIGIIILLLGILGLIGYI
jgi:hypothetical protein